MPPDTSLLPVGNLALAQAAGLSQPALFLRTLTLTGGSREREITREDAGIARTERHLPAVYAPSPDDGLLGHAAFALKHEVPHLGVFAAALRTVPPRTMAAFVAASPTGAYARRIAFLYEFLTGADLAPLLEGVTIGGNYTELLDPTKLVTGEPQRDTKWRVLNNLPGSADYIPMLERTSAIQSLLHRDWQKAAVAAVEAGNGSPGIVERALTYLYRKETRSSFAIERETPSEVRTKRFIETLRRAGKGEAADALSETALTRLQSQIVDPRYAETGFRRNQNYVGSVVRWQPVVHYVPPPPCQLPSLMRGLAQSVAKLARAGPLAQAAVASFGLVFNHPFGDGNGRLHRYLIHDFLTRGNLMPSGLALPVSAAILDDMPGYDHALEAFSRAIDSVAEYTLDEGGELTVTNPDHASWIWRFPDLTPQTEYLGRKLEAAVSLVTEEIDYLVRYDTLADRAKAEVDLPDRELADLLISIHENKGRLSNNRRKQRFALLKPSEISAIETAYREVFGPHEKDAPHP